MASESAVAPVGCRVVLVPTARGFRRRQDGQLAPPTRRAPAGLSAPRISMATQNRSRRRKIIRPDQASNHRRSVSSLSHRPSSLPLRVLTSAAGAVVGERDSGVSQLVTTLLDDPLASDDRVALTLESRRLDPNAPEAILIRSVERPVFTLDPWGEADQGNGRADTAPKAKSRPDR